MPRKDQSRGDAQELSVIGPVAGVFPLHRRSSFIEAVRGHDVLVVKARTTLMTTPYAVLDGSEAFVFPVGKALELASTPRGAGDQTTYEIFAYNEVRRRSAGGAGEISNSGIARFFDALTSPAYETLRGQIAASVHSDAQEFVTPLLATLSGLKYTVNAQSDLTKGFGLYGTGGAALLYTGLYWMNRQQSAAATPTTEHPALVELFKIGLDTEYSPRQLADYAADELRRLVAARDQGSYPKGPYASVLRCAGDDVTRSLHDWVIAALVRAGKGIADGEAMARKASKIVVQLLEALVALELIGHYGRDTPGKALEERLERELADGINPGGFYVPLVTSAGSGLGSILGRPLRLKLRSREDKAHPPINRMLPHKTQVCSPDFLGPLAHKLGIIVARPGRTPGVHDAIKFVDEEFKRAFTRTDREESARKGDQAAFLDLLTRAGDVAAEILADMMPAEGKSAQEVGDAFDSLASTFAATHNRIFSFLGFHTAGPKTTGHRPEPGKPVQRHDQQALRSCGKFMYELEHEINDRLDLLGKRGKVHLTQASSGGPVYIALCTKDVNLLAVHDVIGHLCQEGHFRRFCLETLRPDDRQPTEVPAWPDEYAAGPMVRLALPWEETTQETPWLWEMAGNYVNDSLVSTGLRGREPDSGLCAYVLRSETQGGRGHA